MKKGWDGSFDSPESKYKYTDNMVCDVIENGGRILHEPTIDGYTHEWTDRGSHISDDYYFPQRDPAKSRAHIHYEIKSTGEILIDGKKIKPYRNTGGNIMDKGKQRGRNKSLDGTILKGEAIDLAKEGDRLSGLAKEFAADKEKLEDAIDRVKCSAFSDEEKRKLITELEGGIAYIQEEYDRKVTELETEQQRKFMETIETMQEAADGMQRQSEDLRAVKLDQSAADTSAAADAADEKKQAFEEMKRESLEKLNLQMQQAEIQRRNIRNRRLSGR